MDGSQQSDLQRCVVIGAGIGGLSAAARLAHAGHAVTVIERQATPGGKMRTLPSGAGPVDTGPTVLTLRRELDQLFASTGHRLSDFVDLIPQELLARHFWPGGARLDLFADIDASADAIAAFSGTRSAREYLRFRKDCGALFAAFDAPMMQAPAPTQAALTRKVALRPWLVPKMAPWFTLAQKLARRFSDPRLAQLFGRYATYVGGSPAQAPALLALVAEAEAQGVWLPVGGMSAVADGVTRLCQSLGVTFRFESQVTEICVADGRALGVETDHGFHPADTIVFNGDPRALGLGLLGPGPREVAPQTQDDARSLSAQVWAFAAEAHGADLAHHNVFFSADSMAEWEALDAGQMPDDPTLYVCAQDRGFAAFPPRLERFEIIMNAPPLSQRPAQASEADLCHRQMLMTLHRHGLTFTPEPDKLTLTGPAGWDSLFPGSDGSLYGQSPHGMMAAFRRPTARTALRGLYLAGGGAHPGAGVPMAMLSGRHAAEAIMQDHVLTSMSRPMAMPGGMSTD